MLKVGLTGGIASGKTTVTRLLVEKGAYHIDFDQLAHEVEKKGSSVWSEIVKNFGSSILEAGGAINRRKLAEIVFTNPDKLKLLNRIVHPAVIEEWKKRLREIEVRDKNAIVLGDVPLLFEAGLKDLFDFTIVVYTPPDIQVKRLMERNGFTEEEARLRIANQMPIEEKIPLADMVFDNSLPLEETKSRVDTLWDELTQRQREIHLKRRISP
ncbi:MAG TPA: dephospho-CoA kinase [Syntrophales bacterium]|mgnify:CR=1 FL=1|nr:dephospho-CoA kinase [Syntrophales bacterium]HOL58669.1 dephospho-CoA kinase [Syntrophales bacterium]HPO35043.1 dephospho-CoA kinase [Syntrophales bacterium]